MKSVYTEIMRFEYPCDGLLVGLAVIMEIILRTSTQEPPDIAIYTLSSVRRGTRQSWGTRQSIGVRSKSDLASVSGLTAGAPAQSALCIASLLCEVGLSALNLKKLYLQLNVYSQLP